MSTNETPQIVQDEATQKSALPHARAILIGTAGSRGQMRALVRMAGGRVRSLTVGDRLEGGRIQAIEVGRLLLAKGSQVQEMKLPEG
ncbi:hypothetical protein [Aliiroseovarius sp.]|uniref:hypothetical protein n=1 Tax=Aliiroseovarius sp. TaxID=1872442 RepID=UPI00260B2F82|nr:hypothetical protein [Aliiroseovarius sp.]